jgi:hypothetical protein
MNGMHGIGDLVRERIATPRHRTIRVRSVSAVPFNSAEERRFGTGLGYGLLFSVPFWLSMMVLLLR